MNIPRTLFGVAAAAAVLLTGTAALYAYGGDAPDRPIGTAADDAPPRPPAPPDPGPREPKPRPGPRDTGDPPPQMAPQR
jgi:hypothetical protein